MSGEEAALYARAEILEDTSDLAQAVREVLAGAQGAGVDPRAVAGLTSALLILDPGADAAYDAGDKHDRRRGGGFGSDVEFLEALADLEDQIEIRLREVADLQERVTAARERVQQDLEQGRRDLADARGALAAAYAMGTHLPCTGCHGEREAAIDAALAAIAEAEAKIADAEQRIGLCDAAIEVLDALASALAEALQRVRQVPLDLGEVYELVYSFVRGGGKLPVYGRWVEGEEVNA